MTILNTRWMRRLLWVAAVLFIYAAAGFGLLPYLIQSQAPKFGLSELDRRVSIESVHFNPFTLRLDVRGLQLSEADDAPLLGLKALVVDLQWASLIRRAWSFAEIRVEEPTVQLSISPDGAFNVADLLATIDRKSTKDESSNGLPRLVVERFVLRQGIVDVSDRQAGYANTLSPINFELSDFSTLPGQTGRYRLNAASLLGGKLSWTGQVSLSPMQARGELTLEDASLTELAAYLKPYTTANLSSGRLSVTVPYHLAYEGGRLEANLTGASLRLRDLTLASGEGREPMVNLKDVALDEINANLVTRAVNVGSFRIDGGVLALTRQANGELDWTQLSVPNQSAKGAPAQVGAPTTWAFQVGAMGIDKVALRVADQTVTPPLRLGVDNAQLSLSLAAEQTDKALNFSVKDAGLTLGNLTLASGTQTPLKIEQLGFNEGSMNLGETQVTLGQVFAKGAQWQLQRNAAGELTLMRMLPALTAEKKSGPDSNAAKGPAWQVLAKRVQLEQWAASIEDQATGIKVNVQDLALQLDGASSELTQPVQFKTSLNVREGGQFAAQGRVVPASGLVDAKVQVKQLALAPLQPLLSQYVKLTIAGGQVSAQGQLITGTGQANSPALRYAGGVSISDLALEEAGGIPFAAWTRVEAANMVARVGPNGLDIPDLLVLEPNAKLIIENDRSLNAARLLVKPESISDAPAATPVNGPSEADPFPVRIQLVRLKNATVDFADLSLRPQFGAKVVELNGVVSGLSSDRQSRSEIELDGRVDEFGLARVRGELNPFAPQDNTNVSVVFKNVDIVSASPYTMKFAGYKVAEGKISLDLQYKIRNGKMDGSNQIVLDKLKLGEKVDSPDALNLPLELAIALLKDNDGRIDLALPVSGDMNDPQFSYGAVVWKAIGNVLTKIVTAPFRALGNLLGMGGEQLDGIGFDPASSVLLPPEQEKVLQLASMLGKRAQLKLTVPSAYSALADSAALKTLALRAEIARRTGEAVAAGDAPGPLSLGDPTVQKAMRALYAERLGGAALDQQKRAAETAEAASTTAAAPGAAPAKLPLAQGVLKGLQGEPKVVDATNFYRSLLSGLEQSQPLAADALPQLGARRAAVVLAAMGRSGVASDRVVVTPPEAVDSPLDKTVMLKLGLGVK
ncbi:DUF748 domain-containing protein [Rhodoferax sp. PAMC 29310]|uniref:DUF748 domain-containing protein n=1 Tax=Rhodoferax sp. PAMC 29310 TaxID=2822760 RepID=UPI001B31B8E6|nr:DUF748 domain-containing protein [Rhodoferax sp. PAMC 29310]